MIFLPLLASCFGIAAVVNAWRRNVPLECLPSICWIFLAVVPFAYLARYFPAEAAANQAAGIAMVAVALGTGDLISAIRSPDRLGPDLANAWGYRYQSLMAICLAAFVVAMPIIHLLYAHDIPLFHLLRGEFSITQPGIIRENFSKLLDAPEALKLLFNWVVVVVGPTLAAYFFLKRRWVLFALVVTWCALYATLSAARLPVLLFIMGTSVAILGVSMPRYSRLFVATVVAILLIFSGAAMLRGEALMADYRSADPALFASAEFIAKGTREQRTLPISPGDVERIRAFGFDRPPTFGPFDSSLYRAFLGPMEVANRWYAFFPQIATRWRPLSDLLPLPREEGWQHASNRVAIWAYFERFPLNYLESAHAYAALDADAYSFGGLWACFIAACGLFVLRVSLPFLCAPSAMNRVSYFVGLALLSCLPFQASLQAILIPNGMAFVVFSLLVTNLAHRVRAPAKAKLVAGS